MNGIAKLYHLLTG